MSDNVLFERQLNWMKSVQFTFSVLSIPLTRLPKDTLSSCERP